MTPSGLPRSSTPSAATGKTPLSLTPGGRFGLLTPKKLQLPTSSTTKLQPSPSPLTAAVAAAASSMDLNLSITSYSYGPPVSWGYFSVYFLTSSGAVYLLCPVCPFGCRVPSSVLRQAAALPGLAAAEVEGEEGRAWLKITFEETSSGVSGREGRLPYEHGEALFSGRDRWTAASSVFEGRTPCLKGPLNQGSVPTAEPGPGGGLGALAVALHTSYHLDYKEASTSSAHGGRSPLGPAFLSPAPSSLAAGAGEGGAGFRSCTSCVVSAFSDGRLYAHACNGLLGPTWVDSLGGGGGGTVQGPQCVLDVKGEVRAVRYECPLLPLTSSSLEGKGAASEEEKEGGVPCGGLLLLDLIDLQLPLPALPSAGADEEEEDDSSGPGGVLGPNPGLRRLSLVSCNPSGGGGGGAGKGGGGANAFWAVHESGCWAIEISWLPALARALAAKGLEGGGRGLTEKEVQQVHTAIETVPPPCIKELLFVPPSSSALSLQTFRKPPLSSQAANASPLRLCKAASAMSDLFLGDALVLMQEGGEAQVKAVGAGGGVGDAQLFSSPVLRCFMHRAPPPPSSSLGITAIAGIAAISSSSASEAFLARGGDTEVSEARRQLLEANLVAIYGDLTKTQAPLTLPKPSGSEREEDPEGLIHLQACIALLRQRHVEFAHRAKQSLVLRLDQLGEEAKAHRTSVSELQSMMEGVVKRQAALEERSGKAKELQDNLMERAGLLAQLHWSLPRPLSEQEQQMSAELDAFETKKASLSRSWTLLNKRLQAALSARSKSSELLLEGQGRGGGRYSSGLSAPAAATLPPAQSAKVHAAVLDQFRLISSAMQEVTMMEEEVRHFWKVKEEADAVIA